MDVVIRRNSFSFAKKEKSTQKNGEKDRSRLVQIECTTKKEQNVYKSEKKEVRRALQTIRRRIGQLLQAVGPHIVNRQFFYRSAVGSLDSEQLLDGGAQQSPVGGHPWTTMLPNTNCHCRQLRCQHETPSTPTQPRTTGISLCPRSLTPRGSRQIRRSFGISASDCLPDSFVSCPIRTKAKKSFVRRNSSSQS